MKRPSTEQLIGATAPFALLLVFALLVISTSTQKPSSFFGPAPKGVTLQCLGSATNYLKFDQSHRWQAFAVSNGTSRTFFYTVTELERRTPAGWVTNSPAAAGLMTHRETPGRLSPGASDIFYVTVAAQVTPWRLRVGCFEKNWVDSLDNSVGKYWRRMMRLPPPTGESWSGARYELVGGEVSPELVGAEAPQ